MNQPRYPAGHVFGNYAIRRCIGIGGISEVYEAVHQFLGNSVALKALQLRHVSSSHIVELARAEAILLSRLRHENLVAVTDASITSEGVVWMVMELLKGHTLRDYLAAKGPQPVIDALRFARDVCDGVAAAHEMNVTHRDLKPENVFVTDPELKTVVLDLGMAKFHDFGLQSTGGGKLVGTLRYMSPEQINGEKVDARADIYAVGVILHEMIHGEHPFHRSEDGLTPLNAQQIGVAHCQRIARPLSDVVRGCPRDVSDLVLKAMAKDRNQRFSTMQELAQAIRGIRKRLVEELKASGQDGGVVSRQGAWGYMAPQEPARHMEVVEPSRRVVAQGSQPTATVRLPSGPISVNAATQPAGSPAPAPAPALAPSPAPAPAPALSAKPREETPPPSETAASRGTKPGESRAVYWAVAIGTMVVATVAAQLVIHGDWRSSAAPAAASADDAKPTVAETNAPPATATATEPPAIASAPTADVAAGAVPSTTPASVTSAATAPPSPKAEARPASPKATAQPASTPQPPPTTAAPPPTAPPAAKKQAPVLHDTAPRF